MAVKKLQKNKDTIYFVTFTCTEWISLFEITNTYKAVYKWFDILHHKKCKIIGYVIMPNHIHLLIYIPKISPYINSIIGNGKRFLAYEIISNLKTQNKENILSILSSKVSTQDRKRGKSHQVFIVSSDIKECITEKFIVQKLNYIHNNPISKKWKLVNDITSFPYSSASYYELGKQGEFPVFDYRDLL